MRLNKTTTIEQYEATLLAKYGFTDTTYRNDMYASFKDYSGDDYQYQIWICDDKLEDREDRDSLHKFELSCDEEPIIMTSERLEKILDYVYRKRK